MDLYLYIYTLGTQINGYKQDSLLKFQHLEGKMSGPRKVIPIFFAPLCGELVMMVGGLNLTIKTQAL
jgi:hypothetical protein